MNLLIKIIAIISDSLMAPVIVALLALFLYSLVLLGGFFAMYMRMLEERKAMKKAVDAIECGKFASLGGAFGARLAEMEGESWHPLRCEKMIADSQHARAKELERSKFLVKIGPMCGLMGTLIPLGPALAALAEGDISAMAVNMNLAFTTTVLGVFVGAVGFITYSVKARWFNEEILNLHFILDCMNEKHPKETGDQKQTQIFRRFS